jgi:hypothetical protein
MANWCSSGRRGASRAWARGSNGAASREKTAELVALAKKSAPGTLRLCPRSRRLYAGPSGMTQEMIVEPKRCTERSYHLTEEAIAKQKEASDFWDVALAQSA